MTDESALKPQDREAELSGEWTHDNQQWWNQYMASADNRNCSALPEVAVEQNRGTGTCRVITKNG